MNWVSCTLALETKSKCCLAQHLSISHQQSGLLVIQLSFVHVEFSALVYCQLRGLVRMGYHGNLTLRKITLPLFLQAIFSLFFEHCLSGTSPLLKLTYSYHRLHKTMKSKLLQSWKETASILWKFIATNKGYRGNWSMHILTADKRPMHQISCDNKTYPCFIALLELNWGR